MSQFYTCTRTCAHTRAHTHFLVLNSTSYLTTSPLKDHLAPFEIPRDKGLTAFKCFLQRRGSGCGENCPVLLLLGLAAEFRKGFYLFIYHICISCLLVSRRALSLSLGCHDKYCGAGA